MKNKILFTIIALFLSACSGVNLDAKVGENPFTTPQAQEVAFVQTSRPAKYTPPPTATQTNTAVPTPPAWVATEGAIKLAAAQVELDTAQVANDTAKLGYSATQRSIQLTQEREGQNALATYAAETPTAEALATLAKAQLNVAVTQVYAAATATEQIKSVLATAVYNEVTTKNVGQGGLYGLGAIVLLFVAFLCWRYFSARTAEVNERRALLSGAGDAPNARTQPAPTSPPAPNTLALDRREKSGMGQVDISECPIDADTLKRVAEIIILENRHYAELPMTGKGNPLVKDGNFDIFGEWMVKNVIAIKLPNKSYAIQNRQFFEKIINS